MARRTRTTKPAITATKPVKITVVGFVGNLHPFDYAPYGPDDYGYSFQIANQNARYDIAVFGEARGHVEGEIFIPEAQKRSPVPMLNNANYISVTGTYTTADYKDKDGNPGVNHRIAINFPGQLERLTVPAKTVGRRTFDNDTAPAEKKKTGRPAAA